MTHKTRGFRWDLFLEYLLEALAAGVVAALGWAGRKMWRAYRKRQKRRRVSTERDEKG